ncbi:MAG: Fe-S-containing hydro-lyase [bacterium]|nr:Fe-S-containing hydro-lyase [bacterium]
MDEKTIRLTPPLREDEVRKLRAGDRVLLSGVIYTGRDAAHKRLVEAHTQGQALPLDLSGQVIYYVGPCPAKPGQAIGSAGPTTSGRMDTYAPTIMQLGLKAMVGKGLRSPAVVEAMKQHGAVYLVATGGAGALLARRITAAEVVAYPDLGPEAIYRLEVTDFPTIVAIDAHGGDLYAAGKERFAR